MCCVVSDDHILDLLDMLWVLGKSTTSQFERNTYFELASILVEVMERRHSGRRESAADRSDAWHHVLSALRPTAVNRCPQDNS